ncbi:MAG: GDP-mannose 4,6-dehydratase [Candidatus Euphemobacter frigidus]|nr:GDP-mannose 4,6-dehydratase [Candidatus Euphemobacter frigidus]MDP8276061.1 GDP-mannose 4,6-dehydratase [Candidatus Euphemobacter frigidus]
MLPRLYEKRKQACALQKDMHRALITGIAGFAGSHLAKDLVDHGWTVSGIERHGAVLNNLAFLHDRVRVEECDILSAQDVGYVIRKYQPDVVFHLAGTTFIPTAQNAPQMAFEINVKGSLNILEETQENAPDSRMILVSSAEVYGDAAPEKMPLTENNRPSPVNIYALTKLCAEEITCYYHRVRGLDSVVLRPFNHIGRGQRPSFVTSAFALQIARIEAGQQRPVLEVGNLETARDFTDVRDMVRAYRLAAERCRPATPYNICSGKVYAIKDILDKLLSLTDAEIEIRPDPRRIRKNEIPLFQGDHARFTEATGWEPTCAIEDTLRAILDYWRDHVKKG